MCERLCCNIGPVILMIPILGLGGCTVDRPVAPVAVSVEDWTVDRYRARRLTSEHFDIYSTLEDRSFEAALPSFLESAYQRYIQILPPAKEHHNKLTVYLFGLRRQWRNFVRRHYPTRFSVYDRIRTGGFTEGDTSVSFYVNRSTTLATLAHEGWHQYVASRLHVTIPAWLNEGLACYLESVDYSGDQPRFMPERNTLRINSLREALQQGSLFTLRELVDTHAGEVLRNTGTRNTQTYYAQAWALITFLRHGAQGMYAKDFDRLLADIADGSYRLRLSAAGLVDAGIAEKTLGAATFQTYFGLSSESFDEEYHNHLLQISGYDGS